MYSRSDYKIRGSTLLSVAFLTCSLALTMPAPAQNAPASESEGIQEVLVTANKRVEDAQKVPIAITALTAEDAARTGVVNGQTLAQVVPGLQLNRQTNGSTPFIRGVGNPSTQAGTEPAVAMYVDDVYYGSSAVALTNYNTIKRIEVLKGPQGTLFGRNATGGVISIFTKNPTADPELNFRVGYANYNDVTADLYATGRLSENLTANFALYTEKQNDGWGTNFTTGNPAYRFHNNGGRAKLLWTPSEKTSVLLNIDSDDYFNQQAVFFRPAPGTRSSAGATSVPPAGIYDTNENLDPVAAVKQYGASVKVNHEFSAVNFVSISAYRHSLATQIFAQDGSSTFRLNPTLIYTTKTWTQEFQVLSPAESKFSWVAGVFYLKDSTAVDPFQFNGALAGGGIANRGAFSAQDTKSYSGFFQTTVPIAATSHITAGIRYTSDERSLTGGRVNQNTAGVSSPRVFASNSGISAKWSSVTGRLSFDHQFTDDIMGYVAWNRGFKSGLFNTIIPPNFTPALILAPPAPTIDPPVKPEKIDATSVGMKSQFFNNRLRFNTDIFHYKYKNLQLQSIFLIPGGGTATLLTNAAAATMKGIDIDITAVPIQNLTLTAGFELMEGRYDDFPNGQYNIALPTGGNCAFALGAIITAPMAGAPAGTPNTIGTCIGALPPNYSGSMAVGQPTGTWNLRGNHTIQTPPFSANFTASYVVPFATGSLGFTANFYHSGNYYADADNGLGQIPVSPTQLAGPSISTQANNKQGLVDIINASIAWTANDDKWNARLWGKNLGDTRYWSFANETGTVTKNTPAPPRTYGISFGFNLNGEKPPPKVVKPIDSDGDGVTDDIDRCPATPSGTLVDASGCPLPKDSDGDGVMDPNDKCPNSPAGAKVDASGCELDADGDAVVERLDKCPNTVAGAKVNAEGCEMDADGDGVVDRLDKCIDTPKGDRVDYNGCSFKKELQLPGVVFETNKAELLPESTAVLDGAVSTLKRYPELQIEVAGHTDNTGSAPRNAALSKARAETVLKYLSDNGVTNTLKARGYGEKQPVASNKTADGKQQNRRVVLRILNN